MGRGEGAGIGVVGGKVKEECGGEESSGGKGMLIWVSKQVFFVFSFVARRRLWLVYGLVYPELGPPPILGERER